MVAFCGGEGGSFRWSGRGIKDCVDKVQMIEKNIVFSSLSCLVLYVSVPFSYWREQKYVQTPYKNYSVINLFFLSHIFSISFMFLPICYILKVELNYFWQILSLSRFVFEFFDKTLFYTESLYIHDQDCI